jgi:hypothetical protein
VGIKNIERKDIKLDHLNPLSSGGGMDEVK